MTAWGWVAIVVGAVLCLAVAYAVGFQSGGEDEQRRYASVRAKVREQELEAGTRAAATATRATIEDAVSLLPALRCGGGHADHVKRSDVRRILAEPEALR